MTDPDAAALLSLAVQIAEAAGAELLRRRPRQIARKSSDTDPVTDADEAAEAILVEGIASARPDDGILAEEGARRPADSGLRWILDPLDGTVNFLYGFPAWCVSVACEDGQGTLLGVVHDPGRGETFRARRGGGAWLGEQRLTVRDPVELGEALVATGFSYVAEQRARQAALLHALLPEVRDIRRAGACALDLCWVAAGRLDGYYEDTTSQWDWAAGAHIAAEAGAVVTELHSVPGRSGVVAAGPALHAALRPRVAG